MNTKLITLKDLSEEMLDVLNSQAAVISLLAQRLGVPAADMATVRNQSSASFQRLKAKVAKDAADREAYEEDRKALNAWAIDARFMYADAKEWAKAADVEWLVITERNGSEHGRAHTLRYREPTQPELLKALAEYGGWANADAQKYPGHRARAQRVLPHIKTKLAALLTA